MDKKFKSSIKKPLGNIMASLGAILLTIRYHGAMGRAQRRRAEHQ